MKKLDRNPVSSRPLPRDFTAQVVAAFQGVGISVDELLLDPEHGIAFSWAFRHRTGLDVSTATILRALLTWRKHGGKALPEPSKADLFQQD